MENQITFYQVPFSYSGNNHPYFKTELARETYFNNKVSLRVNLDKPNIDLLENLEVDVRVPIDITQCLQYNYAIVQYNGIKYYCFILDSAHISVNRSRIFLRRDIATQYIDFFNNYMTNFQISRATFKEVVYGGECKIALPDFVHNNVLISNNYEFEQNGHDYIFIPCYVAYGVGEGGNLSGWGTYRPPLSYHSYRNAVCPMFDGVVYYWENLASPTPDKNFIPDTGSFFESIKRSAPYIYSIYVQYLPFYRYNGGIVLCAEGMSGTGVTAGIGIDWFISDVYKNGRYERINYPEVNIEYSTRVENILHLKVFSPFNDITIDAFPFATDNISRINIKISFPFDIEDCIYILDIRGSVDSRQGGVPNIYLVNGNSAVNYTISAEQDFIAQNRYYNDITKITVNEAVWRNTNRSFENLATGSFQAAGGEFVNGGSNIIRGIVQVSDMLNETDYIKKSRELLKKTEFAKPSESIAGDVPYLSKLSGIGLAIIEERLPDFEKDNFFAQQEIYGLDCNIFRKNLRIEDFVINGKFYIKGFAEQCEKMQAIEYTVLFKYLLNGMIWEYST